MTIHLNRNNSSHCKSLTTKNEEIIKYATTFTNQKELQSELLKIYLKTNGFHLPTVKNKLLREATSYDNFEISNYVNDLDRSWTLKDLEFIFYSFLDRETTNNHGVIFTPTEVSDYINSTLFQKTTSLTNLKICDLACGGGEFLLSALKLLKEKLPHLPALYIVENVLYGIDILEENVHTAKILLILQLLHYGEDEEEIMFNLIQGDSTSPECLTQFYEGQSFEGFDFIVGNPPYVKIQQLKIHERSFLRNNFKTCAKGNFNLFYAFIELSFRHLKPDGQIGYIVPNHLLKMKSAQPLRKFLLENSYIRKVIDFKDNQVFENAQTYSSILFLDTKPRTTISYHIAINKIPKNQLKDYLSCLSFQTISYEHLQTDSIHLLSTVERENIQKIESQKYSLEIMTGIATQKDSLYLIDIQKEVNQNEKDNYYYVDFNGTKYKVEKESTIPIIKGSGERKIDESTNFHEFNRIIYPYKIISNRAVTIPEHEMAECFPGTFAYFTAIKEELGKRNGGKPTVKVWYEYGRSQALNSFVPKIIFPTNSAKPNFTYFPDHALFNNGYAIFGLNSDCYTIDLDILMKILNSSVMDYYIKHTSYMISGGYYCYQKKYLSSFTIPEFNHHEVKFLEETTNKSQIDIFLIQKYDLKLP